MAIDNEIYSGGDYGWWDGDSDSTTVLLRYFINPVRFAYFTEVLKQKSAGNSAGKKLLDVGCGGGYLCEEFAGCGYEVTGLDPSQNTLDAARAHAAQYRLPINYQSGKAETIPFGDASFDYVSCCDVLEHVDDVNRTIAEIARVLKPGGLFFYDTINRTIFSWLAVIKIAQDWKKTAWEAPNTHEWKRFIKPRQLQSVMKANGLIMREIKGIGAGNSLPSVMKAILERAKGKISRYEMASRFGFEKTAGVAVSYMGYAVRE